MKSDGANSAAPFSARSQRAEYQAPSAAVAQTEVPTANDVEFRSDMKGLLDP